MADRIISQANLSRIETNLEHLSRLQVDLSSAVDAVSATQDVTRSELAELRARFEEYLRRDELARAMALAQIQVVEVKADLETQFGHHATVRRHATGVLQALDTGLVTRRTIRQVTEELMLDTPRYWLAPALVALAAWIADNPGLAEKALDEALRRDADKTALFFALVLRRHGRGAVANRWLQQYLARQDPSAMSRQLTVIIDAMATGALGNETRPLVREHLDTWLAHLTDDRTVVDQQVARWTALLGGLRGDVDGGFVVLPAVSPTWPQLAELYRQATVHGRALAHFRRLFDAGELPSPDLRRRVDDILTGLVSNYDVEEAPLRRRAAELQAVIEAEGDRVAAARALADELPAHDDTVDFLTLITNAAFYPDRVGASRGTQKLATATAREWISEADGRLEAATRDALPDGVELRIDDWTGRIDRSVTETQLADSLAGHIDVETAHQIAGIRFGVGGLTAAVVGGIALFLTIVNAASGSGVGALFFLLVALVCGAIAASNYAAIPKRREAARVAGETRKATALAQLRGAVAETQDWRLQYTKEMGVAPQFRAFLAGLHREAFVPVAPDQRREVMR